MRKILGHGWLALVLVLVPGEVFSQASQQTGALTVSGHTGEVPVTQINGRPYVAVDALAQLMNGSLGYRGSQITLTLPGATTAAHAAPAAGQSANPAFSRDFLKATIETLSDIREWRSALLTAVEYGYKMTDIRVDDYQAPAAKNLRLASVAATTDSDRNALGLLNKEFGHMQELSSRILTARKNLSYISVDSLTKDSLDQKILKCARSLAAMAAAGQFQDDGSCH